MWFGLILMMVAVPLLELALLIKLGQAIGFWSTVAIIFLTAGVGIAILNAQGFAAFRRASESVAKGQPPVEPVIDGFMLMMAGGLLIAPGLLTDIAGLLLLIPPIRRLVAKWGLARMMASGNIHVTTWQSEATFDEGGQGRDQPGRKPAGKSSGTVIDGEFERIDEKTATPGRINNSDGRPKAP